MKFRGAEAIVETIEWNDQKVVSKTRNKRGYRHPVLEKKLVKEEIIPSGHNSENYIVERLECDSHDGQKIPITITRHKKTKIEHHVLNQVGN